MDHQNENHKPASVLMLEAFYGGSHKQLIDLLYSEFQTETLLYTLPAKKWHWRARTAALYFAETIPQQHSFKSVVNIYKYSMFSFTL